MRYAAKAVGLLPVKIYLFVALVRPAIQPSVMCDCDLQLLFYDSALLDK